MADDNSFSSFLLGLGVGVAVGILFAPKSGAETREFLLNKADEGKDYVKKHSQGVVEQAESYIDRGKKVVSKQKDQITAAVEAGRQAYREAVSQPAASAPTADDIIEGV